MSADKCASAAAARALIVGDEPAMRDDLCCWLSMLWPQLKIAGTAGDGVEHGAADYLLKPFEPEPVALTVKRLQQHIAGKPAASPLNRRQRNGICLRRAQHGWSIDSASAAPARVVASGRIVRAALPPNVSER